MTNVVPPRTKRRLKLAPSAQALANGFARIREELQIPEEFPPEVEAEAQRAAIRDPRDGRGHADRTDVELLTIDPAGSMDLDQAYHAERTTGGFRVFYAIADVAWFVTPGGALDAESRSRGETMYSPDVRTPLYPPVLSEGAASLLPDQLSPAVLWTFELDARAEPVHVDARRALVRSRRRLTYEEAQQNVETVDSLALLRDIGMLRVARERERGGVTLDIPEQEVLRSEPGYVLEYRRMLPIENWNAQISLLTGLCAARLMMDAGIGILRTLPAPPQSALAALRRTAHALGVRWPEDQDRATFLQSLDAADPRHAAILALVPSLMRGAGYSAFHGTPSPDDQHSGIASFYAHATAPLRRVGDRFVNEIALAACARHSPPGWVIDSIDSLPKALEEASARAARLERQILDFVEASVLASRIGETFEGVVTDTDDKGGWIQIAEPAVRARVSGDIRLGERARATVVEADPTTGRTRFQAQH
ncbi:MAG: RNB domain-containing ribonuclease [Actinomycetota bacterium]